MNTRLPFDDITAHSSVPTTYWRARGAFAVSVFLHVLAIAALTWFGSQRQNVHRAGDVMRVSLTAFATTMDAETNAATALDAATATSTAISTSDDTTASHNATTLQKTSAASIRGDALAPSTAVATDSATATTSNTQPPTAPVSVSATSAPADSNESLTTPSPFASGARYTSAPEDLDNYVRRNYLFNLNRWWQLQPPAYPEDLRRAGVQGRASVLIVIDRRGQLLSVNISESSGSPALDEAALKVVRERAPLPAPPALRDATLELELPVDWQLTR